MSQAVFPSLPGMKLTWRRSPEWATSVQTDSSGMETRAAFQSTGRTSYEGEIEFLRTFGTDEVATLLNFFNARQGKYDNFLLVDPYTGSQVRVRFDTDELEFQEIASGFWGVKSVPIISVKNES